jgi:hypothetical protein
MTTTTDPIPGIYRTMLQVDRGAPARVRAGTGGHGTDLRDGANWTSP